ncbi:AAA family ATPase [Actomonas aquatica]|uniref:MoxR family ATPase n=1 Tax=Actomonas aquatica TaxID=2866162 RepID=A0ABZ1C2F9_9BACT|nr:MoxR family ATPase [Opitutus sp. WL0086]WRQ85765.1 MoxR family ATPase [Opitutus sp. WL0086]
MSVAVSPPSTRSPRGPSATPSESLSRAINAAVADLNGVREEIAKVLVGQPQLVDALLIGLLTNGHVLLEGVPGLAKTTAVKALAASMHAKFHRVQFTPDLLPADLIGNLIYNPQRGEYSTKLGPLFANIVLADEINRAPAKVQSALLEAMQEHQVTIGETTYRLPEPFLVLATENPVDQEGTYPLPEAQVDRFMLKVVVDYPSAEEEKVILRRMARSHPKTELESVIDSEQVLRWRDLVDEVYLDEKVEDYIVRLVVATRSVAQHVPELDGMVRFGASPRATINLALAAKAHALLQGRHFVTPQDVKTMARPVLRHRIITTFEAEAEEVSAESIVESLLAKLPVP